MKSGYSNSSQIDKKKNYFFIEGAKCIPLYLVYLEKKSHENIWNYYGLNVLKVIPSGFNRGLPATSEYATNLSDDLLFLIPKCCRCPCLMFLMLHALEFTLIPTKPLYDVESTEKDIETRLTKAWTAINRLSTIWKSDLTDKMKRSFFQAAVTSILLYGCITWTLTKRLEKKLDGNYTRMLRAILNKSWQQHPTRHQLYGHLPPITKTIQVRRTRHAGHCWRSRDELIRDVLLWIPTHGRAKAGRPARTYIQQLCEDTGCCPEDLPRAMNDREEWRERVRDIRAASTIWWWWLYDVKLKSKSLFWLTVWGKD